MNWTVQAFLMAYVLTGCAISTTRSGPDALTASMDAGLQDAALGERDAQADASRDARLRDTTADSAPDAVLPTPDAPDARVREVCNGIDDDMNMNVDEGPTCTGDMACSEGRCVCVPRGSYACDPLRPDRCDLTDAVTREHCGGCNPCGVIEDCSTAGGTPHCVPARIRDFTAASEESGITCIIREQDRHLVCRDTGTWTDTGMVALAVRAWEDTICALREVDARVHCRGPFGGVLMVGDPVRIGSVTWYQLPITTDVPTLAGGFGFSIEGGEGIIVSGGDTIVWGGLYARREPRYLTGEFIIALGDGARRFVVTLTGSEVSLRTWGEPHPTLSTLAWADNTMGGARRVIETIDSGIGGGLYYGDDNVRGVACYHDYCCAAFTPHQLRCWGGPGDDARLVDIPVDSVSFTGSDLRVFPTPSGMRMCAGGYCTSLENLHDPEPLRMEADTMGFGILSRSDWRGTCARNDTGGFDCQGMHTGWPIP